VPVTEKGVGSKGVGVVEVGMTSLRSGKLAAGGGVWTKKLIPVTLYPVILTVWTGGQKVPSAWLGVMVYVPTGRPVNV
jgi:hypothetical protein